MISHRLIRRFSPGSWVGKLCAVMIVDMTLPGFKATTVSPLTEAVAITMMIMMMMNQ